MGFKMVPHFPPSARYLRSYIKSTDLLTDFSLFFHQFFLDFDALPTRRRLPTMYAKRTVALIVPIRPLLTEILRWDSGLFWGGFGLVLGLTRDVPR